MNEQNKKTIMLVTMGTSLFYSASWNFNMDFFDNKIYYKEYQKWLKEDDKENGPGPLISPEKRLLTTSKSFKKFFEAKIVSSISNEIEFKKWLDSFVDDIQPSQILRYSAELSTIFELGLTSNSKLSEYLEKFEICLITDTIGNPHQPNKQYVAAFHIKNYLNKIVGRDTVELFDIPKISSPKPDEMIGKNKISGLYLLSQKIHNIIQNNKTIYIIASGGYKGYGILFGPLIVYYSNVKIIYRHEEGQNLIIVDKNKIYFPKQNKETENTFLSPGIGPGE